MNFLGMSFKIFTLDGIPVSVHFTYLIWAFLQLSGTHGHMDFAVAWITMLFGIVLAHEFGHCYGSRAVGGNPHQILMWPFGGLAFANAPMRVWPQFVTVLCGPLVNVVFVLISIALLSVTGHMQIEFEYYVFPSVEYDGPSRMLKYLALFSNINLWLFEFNMLPFFPMDGGQLLRCGLWAFLGYGRATIYSCYIGIAGAALAAAWSLGLFGGGGGGGGMLLMLAVLGGMSCFQTLMQTRADGMTYDEFGSVDHVLRDRPRGGFWSRLFGSKRRRAGFNNPNPGGWDRKVDETEQLQSEVDRILQKVHDHGIHALTYVERQTLERATREQRDTEPDFKA